MKTLSKRLVRPTSLFVAALLVTALPLGTKETRAAAPREVVVGALLSLTGQWSSLGITSKAALEIASEEINAEFTRLRVPLRVRVVVEDTQLVPAKALEAITRLESQGVRVVVGPQSSAELAGVREFADERGILLVSQGSTASSLALADSSFRFVPSDVHEGEAATALMRADGIKAVVPLWRADAGNEGLHASLVGHFTAAGGVLTDGVRYATDASDFAPVLAAAEAQVVAARAQHGADAVGVYLAGFDEVADIFAHAAASAVLSDVKWYGGDGVALSPVLLENEAAARFAVRVGYPTPTVGLDESARGRWEPLSDAIRARSGIVPDAFALAAYDAIWVAMLARQLVPKKARTDQLRDAFEATAGRYWGASGSTRLDATGDRAVGNYDFFAVREVDGAFVWVRAASYSNGILHR
jgi:branched-chain amino acid transport system substrate-binding protein